MIIKSGINYVALFAFKEDDNTPSTGLTPVITVYKVSDNSKIVDAQNMTEIGLGLYKYTIATASLLTGNAYAVEVDGTASAGSAYRYQYSSIYIDFLPVDKSTIIDTIDTNVDDIETLVTTNLDTKVSLAGQGNGQYLVEFKLTEAGTGYPEVRKPVWLSTTNNKDTSITTYQNTNDTGYVYWRLNTGTYYVFTAGRGTAVGILSVSNTGTATFTQL